MQQSFKFMDYELMPEIRHRLAARYGRIREINRLDPQSQFLKAIISSKTLDKNSDAAFRRLHSKFSSWDKLHEADLETVTRIISPVTFPEQKVKHLMGSFAMICAEMGGFNLEFLAHWPIDASMSWLQRKPGVGPKVAAATLGFSTLRKPIFVVDTHVERVTIRLGIAPLSADTARCLDALMLLMPGWSNDDLCELHWLMKTHGQVCCTHSHPKCGDCVLANLCKRARSEIN